MVNRTSILVLMAVILPLAVLQAQKSAGLGSVESLSWLAGCWQMSAEGSVIEECWLEPSGGILLGVNRTVDGEGGTFFEFMRIADSDSGPVFWASPLGREAVPFRAVKTGPDRVTFENPEHDFPQRVEYALDEADRLHGRISGLDGETGASEWIYERASSGWKR